MDISWNELRNCLTSLKMCDLSKKLVKDYTFSNLTKKINNKNSINFFHKNLNCILEFINHSNKLSKKETRIFITTFIIYTYPDIVINNPNLRELNKKIILLNRKLLSNYENLLSISEINNNNYLLEKIHIFVDNLFKFIDIFNLWKSKDQKDLLNDFIKIYLEIESNHVDLDRYGDKYKNAFLENAEKEKKEIKKKILMLAGNSGIEYFENTIKEIKEFQNNIQKIYEDTTEIVKKAYWNSFEEKINLDTPDYKIILPILEDMIKMLCLCVPNRGDIHYEINKCIDIELLKQMIENEAIYTDDVVKIINYSISMLQKFQPPSFDKETIDWKNKLFSEYQNDNNLGKLIKNFFKNIFEKLELIIINKEEFESTDFYKQIKQNKIDLKD